MDKEGLEKFSIEGVETAFYVADFITEDQEAYLLQQIANSPKPKWKFLNNRSLQNYGGVPHPKGMIREDIPRWLQNCVDTVSQLDLYDNPKIVPNHVLVNQYKPGQGIMPHTDGPLYFPVIATVSLGCNTLINFFKSNNNGEAQEKRDFSLYLERRSLLVLKDDLYTGYLHGIDEVDEDTLQGCHVRNTSLLGDRALGDKLSDDPDAVVTIKRQQPRVSLTIRNVPKALKFKLRT